jgi:protein phosphatase
MKIGFWGATDCGLKRSNNQDSFLIDESRGLAIVADGMGGHSGGEVASNLAVQTAHEVVKSAAPQESARSVILKAFEKANAKIYQLAQQDSQKLLGMGTTMVLCFQRDNKLYIGNVGDSRAYLVKQDKLWQITEDHSLLNEQLKAGMIQEHQLNQLSGKNVITRSVGYEATVQVDIIERPLALGDRFLFCSDGLTSVISDQEIANVLRSSSGEEVVTKAISRALAAGGYDNITVLYAEVFSP